MNGRRAFATTQLTRWRLSDEYHDGRFATRPSCALSAWSTTPADPRSLLGLQARNLALSALTTSGEGACEGGGGGGDGDGGGGGGRTAAAAPATATTTTGKAIKKRV